MLGSPVNILAESAPPRGWGKKSPVWKVGKKFSFGPLKFFCSKYWNNVLFLPQVEFSFPKWIFLPWINEFLPNFNHWPIFWLVKPKISGASRRFLPQLIFVGARAREKSGKKINILNRGGGERNGICRQNIDGCLGNPVLCGTQLLGCYIVLWGVLGLLIGTTFVM